MPSENVDRCIAWGRRVRSPSASCVVDVCVCVCGGGSHIHRSIRAHGRVARAGQQERERAGRGSCMCTHSSQIHREKWSCSSQPTARKGVPVDAPTKSGERARTAKKRETKHCDGRMDGRGVTRDFIILLSVPPLTHAPFSVPSNKHLSCFALFWPPSFLPSFLSCKMGLFVPPSSYFSYSL